MAGKFPSRASPEAVPRLTFVCPSRANSWTGARLSCPKHLAARPRFHGPMPVAPLSDITVELQLPPRRRESLTATRFTPWCNGNTAPFGGVILGSNPSGVARKRPVPQLVLGIFRARLERVRRSLLRASTQSGVARWNERKSRFDSKRSRPNCYVRQSVVSRTIVAR